MRSCALYAVWLLSLPAFATISQVQSIAKWTCGASGQSVTCVITTTSAVTSGNLLAVWTFWESLNSSTGAPYPYTVGVGDTAIPQNNFFYSAVGPTVQLAASTPTTAQVFYAKKINASSGGDQITVTYSCPYSVGPPATGNPACTTTPSIALAGVVVVEYSGLDTLNPLDSVSAGYSASANPTGLLDSGNVAPANSNLLLFAGGITDNGTVGAGIGFSSILSHSFSSGSAITEQNSSAITGNNVLQRATADLSGVSTTGNWVMQVAVFRDAS